MAVDQSLKLYEVTARVETKPTDHVQAEDPQSAADLVAERIEVTVDGAPINGAVEIENVSEVGGGE